MGSIAETPTYGQRLVTVTIDELATDQPSRVFASVPRSSNPKDGFRDITFLDLSRAINRAAWWIEDTFGKSESFETIAYMGPSDPRYFIMALGVNKAGWKVFPLVI